MRSVLNLQSFDRASAFRVRSGWDEGIYASIFLPHGGIACVGLPAEEPKQAADAATAAEPSLAPAEDMLCEETALEPEEAGTAAGCSALKCMEPQSEQMPALEGMQPESDSPLHSEAVPSTTLRKESLSPARVAAALDQGLSSPEAPTVPKGQRGKRSSRKRAASVLWGSSDAEERSAPAGKSESAAGAEDSAAPGSEGKPEDILNNDEAIARALAGQPSASLPDSACCSDCPVEPMSWSVQVLCLPGNLILARCIKARLLSGIEDCSALCKILPSGLATVVPC